MIFGIKIRKHYFLLGLFVVLFTFLSMGAPAAGLSEVDTWQLIAGTDLNIAPQQFEGFMTLTNYKPNEKVLQNRVHIYRKNEKSMAVILTPASQKGQVLIRDGDNMWMYLPNSGKTIRIGAKDNSMGGEFSNADLLRIDLAKDYTAAYLGNETIEQTVCYKLELKAKQRTVAYDKVLYWISCDKELPVKREFFTISGKKIKTMYFKKYSFLGGQERPSFIVIVNEDNPEFKTEMVTHEMNSNVKLDDVIFNPAYAKRLF